MTVITLVFTLYSVSADAILSTLSVLPQCRYSYKGGGGEDIGRLHPGQKDRHAHYKQGMFYSKRGDGEEHKENLLTIELVFTN